VKARADQDGKSRPCVNEFTGLNIRRQNAFAKAENNSHLEADLIAEKSSSRRAPKRGRSCAGVAQVRERVASANMLGLGHYHTVLQCTTVESSFTRGRKKAVGQNTAFVSRSAARKLNRYEQRRDKRGAEQNAPGVAMPFSWLVKEPGSLSDGWDS
jgi:hypothetical protein